LTSAAVGFYTVVTGVSADKKDSIVSRRTPMT